MHNFPNFLCKNNRKQTENLIIFQNSTQTISLKTLETVGGRVSEETMNASPATLY